MRQHQALQASAAAPPLAFVRTHALRHGPAAPLGQSQPVRNHGAGACRSCSVFGTALTASVNVTRVTSTVQGALSSSIQGMAFQVGHAVGRHDSHIL